MPWLTTPGPGEVSHGRGGTGQAWKRGHSFPGLAPQGMSCPGLASYGRWLSFPGMTMHWGARQQKLCPLFYSWPLQVRECLERHAGESIASSFTAGLPRASHVLVLQALEAVAPLLAYAPSSTSHLHRAGEGVVLSSLAGYRRTGQALSSQAGKTVPPYSTAGLRGLDRP